MTSWYPGRDSEHRAVAPVIGIVLIVAITVTLAGVGAAFFLGMAEESTPSEPQYSVITDLDAEIEAEYRGCCVEEGEEDWQGDVDHIYLSHDGGDTIDGADASQILIEWEDPSGDEGGTLRLSVDGEDGGGSGGVYGSEFRSGDTMKIIIANDKYNQGHSNFEDACGSGEERCPEAGYASSDHHGVDIVNRDGDVFLHQENNLAFDYNGDRTIEDGDRVSVTVIDHEGNLMIGDDEGYASEHDGEPSSSSAFSNRVD